MSNGVVIKGPFTELRFVQIPAQPDRLTLVAKLQHLDQQARKLEETRLVLRTQRSELSSQIHQIDCELERIDMQKMDIANQLGD